MSPEAASQTQRLLYSGNIRGANLEENVAGAVSARFLPGTVLINRTSKYGNIFFDSRLGPTLVHEGRHVEQFQGMSAARAQSFYEQYKNVLEMDADLYEGTNYTCQRPQ